MANKKLSAEDLAALKLKYYELAQKGILLESEKKLLAEQKGGDKLTVDSEAHHSDSPVRGIDHIEVLLSSYISGLSSPVAGEFVGNFLFVVEQDGNIKIYKIDESGLPLFLQTIDVTDSGGLNVSLDAGGEEGLLGLATVPDFASKIEQGESAEIFINYTKNVTGPNAETAISKFSVTLNDDGFSIASDVTEVLLIPQPAWNHNGGHLAFGPDGYLYIGMGDGGGAGDPDNNGQNPLTLLGAMLRLDVLCDDCTHGSYSIPNGNPYVNTDGEDEICSIGLRNPWGFSFDYWTGDLWIGDVGQNAWEEVDRTIAFSEDSSGNIVPNLCGHNYGWNCYEGDHTYDDNCLSSASVEELSNEEPFAEFSHGGTENYDSIVGGFVYRGTECLDMFGYYLVADSVNYDIYAISPSGDKVLFEQSSGTAYGNVAFLQDEDLNLFLVNINGTIKKIDFKDCLASLPDWGCVHEEFKNPAGPCSDDKIYVTGCDGLQYDNSCKAAKAGLTSWQVQSTEATTYRVEAGQLDADAGSKPMFNPRHLEIDLGDTIEWVNIQGLHDVNGIINKLADYYPAVEYLNPEFFSFVGQIESEGGGVSLGSFSPTIEGAYKYDCSIGDHAQAGMVGEFTVRGISCPDDIVAGDVNADEQVDVLDVIATVNHILGSSLLDECQFSAADVNGSSAIDVIDVVALVNIILEEPNVRDKELNPVAQGAEIINASVSGYGETMINLGIPYSVELSEVSFEISTTFNQNEDHAPDFIADIFNALSIDINYLGHLGIKYDGNIEDCINDLDGVTDGEINNANNSNCPDLYGLNAPADVTLEITVSDGADYDAVHIINLDVIQSVGADIVVSDSTLINSLQIATVNFGSDLACEYAEGTSSTTSPGDHSVLNFSTAIVNWGNEDFYLGSTACVGQDGCPFYWDTCHLHTHMEGYANYLLYEYPSMDLVEIGNKIGWCVMDLSSVGGQTPPEYADYDTSPNPTYGCSTMGISSGYSDVYSSVLGDQWIDLDALQNAGTLGGEYVIAVCTNIQNADFEDFYVSGSDFEPQPEINYSNNCASARITLDDNNGSVTVSNVAPFLGELIALDCEVTDVAGVEFGVVFHDVSIDQYDINNGDLRLPPVVYNTSDDAALFYRQDLTIFVGDDAVMITNVELPGGLALHHVDPSIAPWSSSSNDSNDFLLSETSCFTIEGIISAEISVDSPFEVRIEGTVNNDPSAAVDLIASVEKVVISSTAIVYGCTDENDLSYNPDATIADGSCSGVLAITGCTASQALNHNPDATQDDGSCIFCGEGGVNVGASYPITVGMYDSDGGGWDGSLQLAYEDTDLLRMLERDNSCADFNEDGSVDVIDVVTLVNTILQTSTDGTDLNGDDSIDVIDVVLLVNYILDPNIVLQCPNEDLSLMFYIPSIDIAYCTEDIDFSVCELYEPAISDTAEFHVNVFEDYKLDIDLKAGYEQGEFKLCALEQNIVVTKSDNLADYYKLDGTISDAPEHFISSESSTFCNNVIGGTVPGAHCDQFFESNQCLDDSFQFDCKGACIETSLANVLDSDNTCQDGSDGGVDLICDSFPLEQKDCGPYCGDGNCDVAEENNANCPSDCVNSCSSGNVLDCSDDDCCPENWIGDGFCDGPNQQWGCNLTCYDDNDGGDCDAFI